MLACADEFWLLSMMFFAITLRVPLMQRVRTAPLTVREEGSKTVEELRPTRASP